MWQRHRQEYDGTFLAHSGHLPGFFVPPYILLAQLKRHLTKSAQKLETVSPQCTREHHNPQIGEYMLNFTGMSSDQCSLLYMKLHVEG